MSHKTQPRKNHLVGVWKQLVGYTEYAFATFSACFSDPDLRNGVSLKISLLGDCVMFPENNKCSHVTILPNNLNVFETVYYLPNERNIFSGKI